ncbi:hypothetical protein [Nocardioides sp. SYSU D00038]|uniref:hypothetical protein n=1 Tax=Nocardioides sp. SYSU D00038 TaxID=2812554 RepID=UPI0019687FC0|nr:hypothetical protein [Nocardioides sp. SYSU D00038]
MASNFDAPRGPVAVAEPPPRVPALPGAVSRWPVATASLVGVVGLFVQVVGYALGWQQVDRWPIVLWYVGFVVLVAPFAALLLAPTRTDHQRLGGSIAFVVLMYASWLLSNPVLSTRFDENLHVTTLVTMLGDGGFFAPNSMLPVSPHYPGLELATAGVHWLTGLPLFACQVFVVLVARLVFVLALFLLASRLGRSTRVGAAAVVLYAGSAQFYFFNAQFSYQTVAIAMLMAALYLLIRGFDSPEDRPWRPLLAAQVCLGALAITHHLTSWITLATLWGLALLFWVGKERRRFRLTLVTAEIATVVAAAWTALIAPLLVSYLGPIFDSATTELLQALDGNGARQVGVATDGSAAPTWEVAVMAASILVWCAMILPAGWRAWRGGTIGRTAGRYLPLLVAVLYPALQLARFSATAGEISDRASTFVTMAMAVVAAAWLAPRIHRLGVLVVPGALVLVLGSTILGSGPDWQRVPGPYLAGAEQRSIDSRTVAVAEWAGRYLPTDSHVAADTTMSRFLPNFADVVPVTQPAGLANVTPLFISRTLGEEQLALIEDNEIDFVVVDERILGQAVRSGSYFEGSNDYGPDAMRLDEQQLRKFDGHPGIELALDGPVRVYDVRPLRGVPQTYADRQPPGLPGEWRPWQVVVSGALLLLGLGLRGKLLDPRRFRARDLWRLAVVLPITMVVGVLGVATGFPAPLGVAVAVLVLGLVVGLTPPARPSPRTVTSGATVLWAVVIGAIGATAVAVAVVTAYRGLLEPAPLPPPLVGAVGAEDAGAGS